MDGAAGSAMSATRRSRREMIECARQRRQRRPVLIADDEVLRSGDRADAAQRQLQRPADIDDAITKRRIRGKAQLVIVTAREQTTERQFTFGAGELHVQRWRSR